MAAAVHALDPQRELAELQTRLGSQSSVARVLGKSHTQIWRWTTGDYSIRPSSVRLIDDVFAVVTVLGEKHVAGTPSLEQLMTNRWPALGNRRPIDLIPERTDEVLTVIDEMPAPSQAQDELDVDLEAEVPVSMELDAELLAFEREIEEGAESALVLDGQASAQGDALQAYLSEHQDVSERLPVITGSLQTHFGEGAQIEYSMLHDPSDPQADQVYVRVSTSLGLSEELSLLRSFLSGQEELLKPVAEDVAIGVL